MFKFSNNSGGLVTDEEGNLSCVGKKVNISNGQWGEVKRLYITKLLLTTHLKGALKTGRKDMAWGYMEDDNTKYLALGIGENGPAMPVYH